QAIQRISRLGVDDTAARDDQWPLRGANDGRRAVERGCVGQRTAKAPYAALEELARIIKCLCLHVLGQRQSDSTGIRLARQHAHRRKRRGDELLWALEPVEV